MPAPAPIAPEQKRLTTGLRAWYWGTAINLAFVSLFACTQFALLICYNAGWLTPPLSNTIRIPLLYLGLAHNLSLIGVWGFKTYASARMMRPIGDQALNMGTLIGRLLMILGSTTVLYCDMVKMVEVFNAKPSTLQTVTWAWTLPVPFGALFLLGGACLALPLAKRTGQLSLGFLLAGLLLLGIVPDVLNLLVLQYQAKRPPDAEMPLVFRFIASFAPIILALAVACEFYAVARLRKLAA